MPWVPLDCVSDEWCAECDANLLYEDQYYRGGRTLCEECANPPEPDDEEDE